MALLVPCASLEVGEAGEAARERARVLFRRSHARRSGGAAMIRVGTAGWTYDDWNGVVYPRPRPRGFDPLAMMGALFDTIEINATFYRTPAPAAAAGWVARTATNPRFRFTAKLPQVFTHDPTTDPGEDERLFREAMAPIQEEGRLGAVLAQFPQSFHEGPEEAAYLDKLLARFSDLPLVVEFRHAGWARPETLELLDRHSAGFCNIDQPRLGSTLPPTGFVTGRVGYVRLHGRNASAWFAHDASLPPPAPIEPGAPHARVVRAKGVARAEGTAQRNRRYDYLYSDRELAPWVASIRKIAEEGADTYVITNNHFRGKAAVNALQIRAALEGGLVAVPDPLRAAYPELATIAKPPKDRLPF